MGTESPAGREAIVLFDGECNLCNGTVRFIIRHDPKERLRFASLQSEYGQRLLAERGVTSTLSTMYLVEGRKVYDRSTAALQVARRLHSWHRYLFIFIAVPRVLRDFVYEFVARRRYRWFGKVEACAVPTRETAGRFAEPQTPSA